MKKKTVFLIGILIGIGLIFFTAKPLVSPPVPPKPAWKTFENQSYGYRLLYPADWEVSQWDIQEAANLKRVPDGSIWHQAKFSGPNGHFEILIWENKSQAAVRNWLSWFRHEDLVLKEVPKEENFTFSGISAFRFVQKKTAKETPLLYVFFNKDDKVFEFVMEREDLIRVATPSGEKLSHPGYDKIMESFVFKGE